MRISSPATYRSIFMRHEDGSVPSSDEMKKAQLQAQEQERIAWENAIPLVGKSCDVYCFDMALSVGDISSPATYRSITEVNVVLIFCIFSST